MILKLSFNVIKGMRLDISPSKANPEYIFDARNIRLTARGNDTLLSISNELGNTVVATFSGMVLGYCVINEFIVVFTKGSARGRDNTYNYNRIYRIYKYNNDFVVESLYYGISLLPEKYLNLGNNIQTLGIYENDNILKVYWVDEINLPRVINIVKDRLESISLETMMTNYTGTSFDFVPTLLLLETVNVSSISNSNGKFHSGVIQYAFTYYTKYGLESNIFYTTDLYNISYNNRGGSPEDIISKAFKIRIRNLDPHFKYLRIYSIHRSSIDATPTVKRIADINYIVLDKDITTENLDYYLRFNSVPKVCTNYKNSSTDVWEVIDTSYEALELELGLRHGKGEGYIFRRGDYETTIVFLIDNQKVVFSSSATADTQIIISKDATMNGPGGGGRLITTNDSTKLAKIKQEAVVTLIDFTDTNTTGEAIDPTLLLYIGGEDIVARTINQKDNTLFLGNISIKRPNITQDIKQRLKVSDSQIGVSLRSFSGITQYGAYYSYENQLSLTNPSTFKNGEHYRLGVQFQYKNGKWSEPVVVSDLYVVNQAPSVSVSGGITYSVPLLTLVIPSDVALDLKDLGFIKARPLVVNPTMSDRKILLLGVVCPTLKVTSPYSTSSSDVSYWSSWFSRLISHETDEDSSFGYGDIPVYKNGENILSNSNKRRIEILDIGTARTNITVALNVVTLHSPDIEFDDAILLLDLQRLHVYLTGVLTFDNSFGDIDILTSSPSIGGAGFIRKQLKVLTGSATSGYSARGIVSGLFYNDYLVNNYEAYNKTEGSYSYMVYPWQSSGSLNNDITRPADKGARSAVLKRKIISNIKFSKTCKLATTPLSWGGDTLINVFNSNEVSLIKMDYYNYYGNIDTLLINDEDLYKTIGKLGFSTANNSLQTTSSPNIGSDFKTYNPSVRIKYKSTPHILLNTGQYLPTINNTFNISTDSVTQPNMTIDNIDSTPNLFLAEIRRDSISNAFGGNNEAAYKSNLWIPSGEPVLLTNIISGSPITWLHGDCYYQRYDCLKTYPFTQEDENSIVEVISFMVETRVNIDGRYDRNRGLESYFNVTPLNFNLLNNIYTLKNNFFNYRVLDLDYYKLNHFPNTITWSKEKTPSEDVDTWTNITMTNTFDVDGNLGEIVSVENYNNELYCFQKKGLSKILFNSRVLITPSDNVPIEISNGYKVLGKVYLSNNIGCQNQRAIKTTPNGIYFPDLYNSGIYLLNQLGILDISTPRGFTNWVKTCLPNRTYYDTNNGDVYFIGDGFGVDNSLSYKNCLCFSEKLNEFTSFMDYYSADYMFNLLDNFYAIGLYNTTSDRGQGYALYELFSGEYNRFFERLSKDGTTNYSYYPYHISYIANQNPTNDKIFNTLEFRADSLVNQRDRLLKSNDVLSPNICPFNKVTVWNEYQEGTASLSKVWGKPSSLKEKFRTWRVNIPRDSSNNRDRIRNPWVYIKLEGSDNTNRMLLHDLLVYYYDNSIYGYGNLRQL